MKKQPKKKKPESLSQLRSQCDSLMQEIGRMMNPFCVLCGRQTQVMHHFIPKSVSARLRYHWDNLIPLDNGCHHRLHQSGDPSYEQRIIDYNSRAWYDRLQEVRKEEVRVNIGYYRGVKEEFIRLRDEIRATDFSFDRQDF